MNLCLVSLASLPVSEWVQGSSTTDLWSRLTLPAACRLVFLSSLVRLRHEIRYAYPQKFSGGIGHNNGCRDRNHPWAMRVIHDPVNLLRNHVQAHGGVRSPCVYVTSQHDHHGFAIHL